MDRVTSNKGRFLSQKKVDGVRGYHWNHISAVPSVMSHLLASLAAKREIDRPEAMSHGLHAIN
ncbi:hypothetical protein IMZ48_17665 [Candidatus Bathyarchaeota archaeon]|nr:hypothetical protein [Candidatus Bathyarchaeota archaeon]